ncbi:13717_t:CDS:1, partial [Funneliformis mosseae]
LAVQDEFNGMDYLEFLSISKNVKERAGTDSEPFLGNFLNPKNIDTNLTKEILDLLVEYYRNTYNEDFVTLSDIHIVQSNAILIFLKVNIYGKLQLDAEVFRSIYLKRHINLAKILSQFIDGNSKDTYPGIVQYYFEYTVYFLNLSESKKHSLAFVR